MTDVLYDLRVKHTKTNPVFVIGCARSGTSVLIRLIRKYLKINFGTETQFIIRYYNKIRKYSDLNRDSNLKILIDDISKERCFSRWKKRFGFDINFEEIYQEVMNKQRFGNENNIEIYQDILTSMFEKFARYHRMTRWGDKTPDYILNLPVLIGLYPKAQFIHIVRDGRDVALSLFQTPFGNNNVYKAAVSWKADINRLKEFAKKIPKDQLVEIRYEDLLNDPEKVFSVLIKFLGIEDNDNNLMKFISENIRNDLKQNNTIKWKKLLSLNEQFVFDKIACDILSNYDYETNLKNVQSINLIEKIYWELDNALKKGFDKRYWSDNFYKFNVKVKEISLPMRKFISGNNYN